MDVITCHLNADFDALASMMAAKKLYPDAHIVFPGAQERSMREFFLQTTFYMLKFDKMKSIEMDKVDRLILVDTKTKSRVGRFAEILDRPGLKVHVYDHHPFTDDDIRGEYEKVEQLGACTTIFTEIIKEKAIPISPEEATVMALGIYEETGSLVFASTTPRDIMAAAWLLEQGANLNVVADFITRELDADQVALLNDLIKSQETYYYDGIKVVIATASASRYVQDIAILAHKLRDMEGLDALFCLVSMEDRVHLIARSRVYEVDAGIIAGEFGGGGHATAASATIRDMDLGQVVERLIDRLKNKVQPSKLAGDIMTSPVITIKNTATLKDAGDHMTRYNVNVLPVLRAGRLVGLVTREVVMKSIHHGLGRHMVMEFMTTDFRTVTTDTPFKMVEDIMIKHTQRFLPVVEQSAVVGAITRTDLLRALHEDLMSRSEASAERGERKSEDAFIKNVAGLIEDRLPKDTVMLLKDVGATAEDMGLSAYVAGGSVRDLLLGMENLDLDIVVEGHGIDFAAAFAKRHKARVRSHQKFGTAVVVLPSGMKFDIATARTEFYEYPAALPTVELGSIKKDLYRRDFTINALAIVINEKGFGDLIDFFGGQKDIKEKTIRVLHNLSLIEDPTRAYRAIRFEARMGFTISKHTQNLIKNAVNMELFHRLAGGRVYTELTLIFKETAPLVAMKRLDEFGLLRFVHEKIRFTPEMEALFAGISETLAWFRLLFLGVECDTSLIYFMGLFEGFSYEEQEDLGQRLTIPERHMVKLREAKRDGVRVYNEFHRDHRVRPYQVYRLLKPLSIETILYMMARAKKETAKKKISLYLTQYKDAQTLIHGNDLKRLMLPPGPIYSKILDRLLEARLNGEVETREQEEAYVVSYIKKHPGNVNILSFKADGVGGGEGGG